MEFQEAFARTHLQLIPQTAKGIVDAEETASTFLENALIKARHAASKSGLPALADDSGLCVSALNGAPGVYSARYAGTGRACDNIHKLLQALDGIADRRAYFCCVLVWIQHAMDPNPLVFQGVWSGEILAQPRGEQGFGYDPIFYIPSLKKSAAELSLLEKNECSHRAKAIKKLLEFLNENPYDGCTI